MSLGDRPARDDGTPGAEAGAEAGERGAAGDRAGSSGSGAAGDRAGSSGSGASGAERALTLAAGDRRSGRRQLGWVVAGAAAVVLGMVAAGSGMLAKLLEPPFPAGLLLGAAAGIVGVLVVLRAIARIGPAREDARELIRAVRLLFVAVGLFAAAAGWIVGSALPIVVGLIIVGIDVIETSFLLLVTAARPDDRAAESATPGAPQEP